MNRQERRRAAKLGYINDVKKAPKNLKALMFNQFIDVKQSGMFHYFTFKGLEEKVDVYEHLCKLIGTQVYDCYLNDGVRHSRVPSTVFDPDLCDDVSVEKVFTKFRKFVRKCDEDTYYRVRLVDGINSVYAIIMKSTTENTYIATLAINDADVSEFYAIEFNISNKETFSKKMHYVGNTGIYTANKSSKASRRARECAEKIMFDGLKDFHMNLIDRVLDTLFAEKKSEIPYNKMELKLFSKILDFYSLDDKVGNLMMILITGFSSEKARYRAAKRQKSQEIIRETVGLISDDDARLFPIIDLNESEWKFINRYMENKIEDTFNLKDYLIDPRYGNSIKMSFPTEDGNSRELVISYILSEDDDMVVFRITDILSDKMNASVYLTFNNIENFNTVSSIMYIDKYHIISDKSWMVRSVEELASLTPIVSIEPHEAVKMIHKVISLYVAIKDRPKRTRVVRKTIKKEVPVSNTPNAPKEEKDYTVARILKPAKEVKEYVQRMTKQSSGSRRPAEYTVEEWERTAHQRHYADGRVVWVRGTICHRQLPLTQKEIHIKL